MKKAMLLVPLAFLVAGCASDRPTATGDPESGSGVAIGGGSPTVAGTDASFAREACQTGVAEAELGKMAAKNTRNPEVRALARRIAEDHARAEKELGQLFARKGLPPEKDLAPDLRSSLARLAALKGREFDQAFREQVIEDHQEAIALFEQQAEQGMDADFRAFAQRRLPQLREHLAMAQSLDLQPRSRTKRDPTAVDVLGNPATRNHISPTR